MRSACSQCCGPKTCPIACNWSTGGTKDVFIWNGDTYQWPTNVVNLGNTHPHDNDSRTEEKQTLGDSGQAGNQIELIDATRFHDGELPSRRRREYEHALGIYMVRRFSEAPSWADRVVRDRHASPYTLRSVSTLGSSRSLSAMLARLWKDKHLLLHT